MRLEAIIVGVVATALPVALRFAEGPGFPLGLVLAFGAGLALVIGSMVAGIASFLKPHFAVGPQASRIEDALDMEVGDATVRREAVRAYRRGSDRNYVVLERAARRFRVMLVTLATGLVAFAVGTLGLLAWSV